MKTVVLGAIAALTLAATAHAAPALVSFNPTQNFNGGGYALGYQFTLSGSATIDALGYQSFGAFVNPHFVVIYAADGANLAAATVDSSSTLSNGFAYTTLPTPVTLAPGTYSIVGATNERDLWTFRADSIVTDPRVTIGTSVWSSIYNVDFPPDSLAPTEQYLLVNFDIVSEVPEPTSMALLATPIALTILRRRRR